MPWPSVIMLVGISKRRTTWSVSKSITQIDGGCTCVWLFEYSNRPVSTNHNRLHSSTRDRYTDMMRSAFGRKFLWNILIKIILKILKFGFSQNSPAIDSFGNWDRPVDLDWRILANCYERKRWWPACLVVVVAMWWTIDHHDASRPSGNCCIEYNLFGFRLAINHPTNWHQSYPNEYLNMVSNKFSFRKKKSKFKFVEKLTWIEWSVSDLHPSIDFFKTIWTVSWQNKCLWIDRRPTWMANAGLWWIMVIRKWWIVIWRRDGQWCTDTPK